MDTTFDRAHGEWNDEAPPPAKAIERMSVHCYGGKAALCWEAGKTRKDGPTVFLQAATTPAPRAAPDWKNKITLQLSFAEMASILAVFARAQKSAKGSAHGEANDKGFEVEDQGKSFFVKVFQKDKGTRAVPVTLADALAVSSVLITQLLAATPGTKLTDQGLLTLVRLLTPRGESA